MPSDTPDWHRPPKPYEKGNKAALKYGAFSPSIRDRLADQIVAAALDVSPYLADAAYTAEAAAWARAEAVVLLASRHLDEHGFMDSSGNPRNAVKALADFEGMAAKRQEATILIERRFGIGLSSSHNLTCYSWRYAHSSVHDVSEKIAPAAPAKSAGTAWMRDPVSRNRISFAVTRTRSPPIVRTTRTIRSKTRSRACSMSFATASVVIGGGIVSVA